MKWLLGGVVAVNVVFWAMVVGMTAWTLMDAPVSSAKVDDEAHTRYPIVLAHGVMGFGQINQQSYWRNIPETLRAHGATVYVTQVSAFNSTEVRGEQLLAQVEQILRESGAEKVNLIGHSHGSQSVRYVAGKRPQWVASVTAVSGPTMGSETSDWLLALEGTHPAVADAIYQGGELLGRLINYLSDKDLPLDPRAAVRSLTVQGTADFNARFPAGVPTTPCGEGAPEVDGIRYYSWSLGGPLLPGAQPGRLPHGADGPDLPA
ncbi:MAG: triacylglycerol lipase [Aquabacterium sp.]